MLIQQVAMLIYIGRSAIQKVAKLYGRVAFLIQKMHAKCTGVVLLICILYTHGFHNYNTRRTEIYLMTEAFDPTEIIP